MGAPDWDNQVVSQVIIVGSGGQLLVYQGNSIAANNLIGSVSGVATTDHPGNTVFKGITGISIGGGNYFATQVGGGTNSSLIFSEASSEAGPWTTTGFINASTGQVTVNSSAGLVLATGGSAGAVVADLSSGLSGGLPVSQLDRTPLSVGNSATATDITNTWTIPANDAANGAKYTIETFVTITTGATTAETFTLGADIDGGFTLVPLATLGSAFNGSALSTTYGIAVRLHVVPGAGASAADAQITLEGSLGDTSSNRLATNSANMSGFSNTTPYSTGFTHSVALYAQWGGAGGAGQSAGANWSSFTRSGQN